MSSDDTDLMGRLAAADPAGELLLDDAGKAHVWSMVAGTIGAPVAHHGARGGRGRRLRRGSLLALAAVPLAVGVAFASGLVQVGAPVKTVEGFDSTSSGFGAVLPESVQVLPISTPDPQGGPPWGIRVFSTSRGVGCIQVGRLVDGEIGVLGSDGAFGDDGRFHELPVRGTFAAHVLGAGRQRADLQQHQQERPARKRLDRPRTGVIARAPAPAGSVRAGDRDSV